MTNVSQIPVEAAPNRLLRRSRTGCLTCRRRKKKCPEQYDEHGNCERCKEGGWRCIRPGAEECTGSPRGGPSGKTESPPLDTKPPLIGFLNQANGHQGRPQINSRSTQSTDGYPYTSPFNATAGPSQAENTTAINSVPTFDFAPTEEELAELARWLVLPQSPGANGILPYDPSFNPDLHPPVTSFDPLGIVNTQAGLRESWDPLIPNDHPSVASTSSLAHPNANDVNPSIQPVSAPDEALLAEFYEDYLIPAMSITYIRSQRPQFAERIHSITSSCQVARLARQAVAATYLSLYKDRKRQWPIRSHPRQAALNAMPIKYLAMSEIDVMGIFHAALAGISSASSQGLPLETRLWILSDLNMAAHALSDTKHFELASKMANQLLDVIIANHADPTTRFHDPEFFPLRVATMVDLNRSLSSRRPTCFDFSSPKTRPWPQDPSRFSDHEVTWYGCPPGLALLLIQVANATAEGYSRKQSGQAMPDSLVQTSLELEDQLLKYQPRIAQSTEDAGVEPFEVSAAERAVEMDIWKTLGLILLDRLVFGRSTFDLKLRERLEDMQAMLQAVVLLCHARERQSQNFIDFWSSYYSGPAFFAASLAVEDADRRFYRRFFREIGPEKALLDLLVILEKTWAASDDAGHVRDWFEMIDQTETAPLFF